MLVAGADVHLHNHEANALIHMACLSSAMTANLAIVDLFVHTVLQTGLGIILNIASFLEALFRRNMSCKCNVS